MERCDDDDQRTAQDAASTMGDATHLVVFVHGLLGSEADFANARALFQRHLGPRVFAHVALSNATRLENLSATCDGIDCGAARLASEIVRVASQLPRLEKLSLVGHSMGGLYARYCIGLLYAQGFFEHIEPVNFVTLATPHLGNRRPQRGSVNFLYNAIAPRLFDRTGSQFALADEASDETLALSRRCEANKYPHRKSYAASPEIDGVLLVRVGSSSEFVPRRCELKDRVLSIYASPDVPETNEAVPIAQIELLRAEVTAVLPDKASDVATHWELDIQPQEKHEQTTLRLPHGELSSLWKWIPALSNASCGIHCRSSASKPPSSRPALLTCLTRGQFQQALQLFRVRALYATVFNDHTVPYSCASVRAFNPYRLNPQAALATSPYYDHIVERSLAQAPRLRRTLPVEATMAATRKSTANVLKAKQLEASTTTNTQSSNGSWTTALSSLFLTGAKNGSVARSLPFIDERDHLVVDRADDSFSTDDARDTLRGMLLTLQSVGWRRLDVALDSLMAHEMVIAKRADLTAAPCDGGLDILHHVMDTMEL